METGCLQVPDWTGQRCWLGSSSCCCCCWCFPRPSSWCCPPTSSFSGACWAAAALAPLAREGEAVSPEEKQLVHPQPFFYHPHLLPSVPGSPSGSADSPGGATIRCHFWNRQVLRQSRGLRL